VTTSDFLKVQADLMIAADGLRTARIDEFLRVCDELEADGCVLMDRNGQAVSTDPALMRKVAVAARKLREARWARREGMCA
jgi:hypothetical protein